MALNDLQQQLLPLRQKIDSLDEEILRLFNTRAKIAQEIGQIKAQFNAHSAYHPAREAEVLNRLTQQNTGPLKNENLIAIFKELMSATLALEKPLRVAFLGPWGTFSESAARKHFGHAAELFPEHALEAVFRLAESEKADYAVVPIENSTEGSITQTIDLLLATPLKIVGEVVARISQNLFSNASNLTEIHKVYAHPQSLAQCREWLQKNLPHTQKISMESNAAGVLRAQNEENAAAIAGETVTAHYNVALLAEGIETSPHNSTRFFVLGKENVPSTGKDRTSLMMAAPDRTGSLQAMLLPFTACGVSMTHLESRPAANALWKYIFFAEIEGHQNDFAVAAALRELNQRAAYLKVLGSYPCAV